MLETIRKKKVLTVGEGDLSLSLALSRAYGDHIDVTASVIESDRLEFLRVFPEAPLEELHLRKVPVLYGVDATQLHLRCAHSETEVKSNKTTTTEEETTKIPEAWDLISFHHPHLGISNLEEDTESKRAVLHHCLLCHYLHSAKQISKLVHVCLTGTQPTTWKLMEAAKLQNLTLVKTIPDSKPFANVWMNNIIEDDSCDNSQPKREIGNSHEILPETAKAEPHFAAPRRYRNGKLGRHSLARYGYRHRRTEGALFKGSSKDANVSESMHFVFAADNVLSEQQENSTHNDIISDTFSDNKGKVHVCTICNESFYTECALKLHLASPVRPPVSPEAFQSSIVPDDQHSHFRNESEHNLNAKCPQSPTVEPSREAVQNKHVDYRRGTVLIVSSVCHGKRLRWFLQHSKIDNCKFTKRIAESTIQAGLILVNGHVALDSSRILQVQDSVTIIEMNQGDTAGELNPKETVKTTTVTIQKLASKNPQVEIMKRSSPSSLLTWLVAVKPSGMRTKGKNIPGTLESIVSEQEESDYSCISSLETSCSGLCVLVVNNDCREGNISVMHTLTVLVHGKLLRDVWFPSRTASLTLEAKWRQKKKNKKRKHELESLSKPQENETFQNKNTIQKASVRAEIKLEESGTIIEKNSPGHNTNTVGLSTMQVVTREPSSSSICHYFRQEGFPVVGDAFCKQEYLKLKRSIRNRLKNKLCIGCFRVEIKIAEEKNNAVEEVTTTTLVVEIPSPKKLSAIFWENFLKEETTRAPPQVDIIS